MLCALNLTIERLVSQVIHNHPRAPHKEGSKKKDEKELEIGQALRSKKKGPKRWEE
jgi:hypothetical protein